MSEHYISRYRLCKGQFAYDLARQAIMYTFWYILLKIPKSTHCLKCKIFQFVSCLTHQKLGSEDSSY